MKSRKSSRKRLKRGSKRSKKGSKKASKKRSRNKLSTRWSHRPSQLRKKQSGSKYETRPSPPIKAKLFCDKGSIHKGNDGQDYISKKGSDGICRWVLYKQKHIEIETKGKTYITLDNGGRPYLVDIDNHHVSVFINDKEHKDYGKKVWSGNALEVFVGDSKPKYDDGEYDWTKGTSVLVKIKPEKYVFIGNYIFEFNVEQGDTIVKYYTPTGNSAVPYPYAVGKHNTYLMVELSVLPHTTYDPSEIDPYEFFYHLPKKQQKNWNQSIKIKKIHDGLY